VLALIGIKDYIYAAIIAVILAGGAWEYHHIESIGEQKIEVADAKVEAARAALVAQAEKLASAKNTQIGETYEKGIGTPVTNVPTTVRLCNNAPSRVAVPAAARSDPGPTSPADSGTADTSGTPDPRIAKLIQIGHDANVTITALQAYDAMLRSEMQGAK
jgi:hypothetical protein